MKAKNMKEWTLGDFGILRVVHRLEPSWVAMYLIVKFFLLVIFNNKNSNHLKLDIILNNEVIVLKSFIWMSRMACSYFSKLLTILKGN
jgi:hypothetical protein